MGVSERRACAALGQHRSTQRKVPRGRDDEERLTADTVIGDTGRLTLVTEIHLAALALIVALAVLALRDWWRFESALPPRLSQARHRPPDRPARGREPPPREWSTLRYGFGPEEDRDGEQEAQA